MASSLKPNIVAFKADAAITKGMAVKFGTDDQHVAKSAATTNYHMGIAQSAPTAAEDVVEVAVAGGGAKGLCQTTVTRGHLLTAHTDGKLKPIAAAGDRLVAIAMESGVAGDLIEVIVIAGQAYQADV